MTTDRNPPSPELIQTLVAKTRLDAAISETFSCHLLGDRAGAEAARERAHALVDALCDLQATTAGKLLTGGL